MQINNLQIGKRLLINGRSRHRLLWGGGTKKAESTLRLAQAEKMSRLAPNNHKVYQQNLTGAGKYELKKRKFWMTVK